MRTFGPFRGTLNNATISAMAGNNPQTVLNIYTNAPGTYMGGTLLGWATFPWELAGNAGMDGVVMNNIALNLGGTTSYNAATSWPTKSATGSASTTRSRAAAPARPATTAGRTACGRSIAECVQKRQLPLPQSKLPRGAESNAGSIAMLTARRRPESPTAVRRVWSAAAAVAAFPQRRRTSRRIAEWNPPKLLVLRHAPPPPPPHAWTASLSRAAHRTLGGTARTPGASRRNPRASGPVPQWR
jgi:hypothetical protein